MAGLTFEVVDEKAGRRFKLAGAIDDVADFTKILGLATPAIILDFEKVTHSNSFGIKTWAIFVGAVTKKSKVTYEKCPVGIAEQFNMIQSLSAGVTVQSFYAPFSCDSCDIEESKLITREEALVPGFLDGLSERYPCSRCNRKLKFFDDEEIYFGFVK